MVAMHLHPWHILVIAMAGWMNREQSAVIEYLKEENRALLPSCPRIAYLLSADTLFHALLLAYGFEDLLGCDGQVFDPDAGCVGDGVGHGAEHG